MVYSNKSRIVKAALGAVVFAWALQAEKASAVVIVLGNGLANVCYQTALAISQGQPAPSITLTGTNIDTGPVELCTAALDADVLGGRDLAGTYVNRGVILFMDSRFQEALADFDRAVKIDDRIGEAHANRGAALVAMKRWPESITAIDMGIERGTGELAKSYYNRAIAHEEVGNIRAAYYDYMKAAELIPTWEAPKAQLTRFMVRKRTS
jgi:tetratricopeptide (TPR) repeat protein